VKAFLGASVKLEYHCDLLNGESPYKHINEIMDLPILKTLDLIVPIVPVRLEHKNSLCQSYSIPSIDLIANQEKRRLSVASLTGSKSPLSIID